VSAEFPDNYDAFGQAIAISGDGGTLAVGAPKEASVSESNPQNNVMPGTGAVYIFTPDASSAGSWTQQAYVKKVVTIQYNLLNKVLDRAFPNKTLFSFDLVAS
jgi:hypothetical protein